MADKNMGVTRLWPADGGEHMAEVQYEVPEDGSQPTVIEHNGKTFVWNQRNSQYREAVPVKSSGKAPADALAPAQAAEAKTSKD